MSMTNPDRIELNLAQQQRLRHLIRAGTTAQQLAQRARIVLLAADGVANYVIAERVGGSRPMVNLWRGRYVEQGLDGLVDRQRPGRPRVVDRAKVIAAS